MNGTELGSRNKSSNLQSIDSSKRVPRQLNGGKNSLKQMVLGQLDIHMQKKEAKSLSQIAEITQGRVKFKTSNYKIFRRR